MFKQVNKSSTRQRSLLIERDVRKIILGPVDDENFNPTVNGHMFLGTQNIDSKYLV